MLLAFALLCACPGRLPAEEPTAAAQAGFDSYIQALEGRLKRQHAAESGFLAPAGGGAQAELRLRQGELMVETIPAAAGDLPGANLYHWRGTAFAAGATAADFERLMRDFNSYPKRFAPQVIAARVLARNGDRYQVRMRVRQKHVITVVMDTDYEVEFALLDSRRGYNRSRSTRIAEIEGAGTAKERALTPREAHGFLWRLNTYWSYEERDGGLYMQIESVSLTRSIPRGLGWAVGPFVESVPRDSLEFTLRAVCDGLRR